MTCRRPPANRVTRVIAALIVLSFGAGIFAVTPMPPALALAGAAVAAIAGCVLCREALAYSRERWRRRDRYDLSLLDDAPRYNGPSRDDPDQGPETPSWESEEGDVVYCHRCDVSMTTALSVCPKCGCRLGH